MSFASTKGVAAVLVGAAAVALAGCGGGGGGGGGGGQLSKAEYSKQLTSIANDVKKLQGIGGNGAPSSSQIDQIQSTLRTAADRVSKLNPPSNVKQDNKDLAAGLRQLADALGPVSKALKDRNAAEAQSSMAKVQSATQKFQHAVNDLKSKGYNTG